jgi:ankyrin repeat protein
MNKPISYRAALACALLLGAALAPAAYAQVGPVNNPGELLNQGANMAPAMAPKHRELPPALPGAAPSGNVAPATQVPSDMSPNAALFDAINRGDIAAARDALSRGAELHARNVLGLTPMELSVDLGRNDISFLLLSYRGEAGSGATPASATAKAAASAGTAAKGAPKPVHPIRTAERAPIRHIAADSPADPSVAPQAPRLFANDGGTPVPNAGFLGFNSQPGPRQ